MDFCVNKYELLIKVLIKNNIRIYSVRKWLEKTPDSGVIIRHDVDRRPQNALKIAKLEANYNISTTYYFRITKSSFKKKIIEKIKKMGHEIGYHYEDLALQKGNYHKAIKSFENNLKKFTPLADIKTIAMHGRPFSPYDSRDLWQKYNFKDFKLMGEAFLSINYTDIFYFTDTGRTWSNRGANLRDKVNSAKNRDVSTTDELMDFLENNKNNKTAIVSHPERWASTKIEYFYILLQDTAINILKRIIIFIRKA